MRVVDFEDEDTEVKPVGATAADTVSEVMWEEERGGEMVLRVTPVPIPAPDRQ